MGIALVAAVAMTYGAYRGAFRPGTEIIVESGRAGLALRSGALVKRHGVEVGRVVDVGHGPHGATVTVRLEAGAATSVPAGTGADITSTTLFGEKYIALTDPPAGGNTPIRAGATIPAGSVTVEIDTVFDSLTAVLRAVEPERLNVTLSALAGALRGQGAALGQAIDDANSVLAQIDPRLPQLRHDIRATADTATVYAGSADDLSAALGDVTTTADTVVRERDTFDHMLLSVIGMADTAHGVLDQNSEPLITAIGLLHPTTSLLGRYASELTCFLQGADEARTLAEPVTGGNGASMLLRSTLLLGSDPYRYPQDLPVVRAGGGPRCGSLPKMNPSDVPAPYVVADTGANPFRNETGGPRLVPGSILDLLYPTATTGQPR